MKKNKKICGLKELSPRMKKYAMARFRGVSCKKAFEQAGLKPTTDIYRGELRIAIQKYTSQLEKYWTKNECQFDNKLVRIAKIDLLKTLTAGTTETKTVIDGQGRKKGIIKIRKKPSVQDLLGVMEKLGVKNQGLSHHEDLSPELKESLENIPN